MKKITVNHVVKIGIFAALSIVFYFIKTPLAFIFPSWLEFQLSNLPIMIGGFALGPISGVVIVVVRFLVKLPFTSTMYVGEFADLLIGFATVLASSLVYEKRKDKKGAILGLFAGSVAWVITAVLCNQFLLIPTFLELYFKGNVDTFIGGLKMIPGVTSENYMFKYILFAVIPFNILLSGTVSVITFFVYKRISSILHKYE